MSSRVVETLDTRRVDLRLYISRHIPVQSYYQLPCRIRVESVEIDLLATHPARERPSSYNNYPHKAGSIVVERESSVLVVIFPLSVL